MLSTTAVQMCSLLFELKVWFVQRSVVMFPTAQLVKVGLIAPLADSYRSVQGAGRFRARLESRFRGLSFVKIARCCRRLAPCYYVYVSNSSRLIALLRSYRGRRVTCAVSFFFFFFFLRGARNAPLLKCETLGNWASGTLP